MTINRHLLTYKLLHDSDERVRHPTNVNTSRVLSKCLLAVTLLSTAASGQLRGYSKETQYPEELDVSLVQLIAEPQKYDGKRVQVIGFMRIEFEGNAIYLHREDFEYGISKNALWVDIPTDMTKRQRDDTNLHYVICVGVFRAKSHGHMGMFSGTITEVKRLERWVDRRPLTPIPPPPSK